MNKTILLPTIFVLGCSTTARLYPVSGPLFNENKTLPLKATVNGVLGNNGSIFLKQSNDVVCEGEWSSAAGAQTTISSTSLIGQYGSLVGISQTSGGGQNPGQAVVICPDGNSYTIEFLTGGGTSSGFGVAKDRNGNIFRVLF